MSDIPTGIRSLGEEQKLELSWPDNKTVQLPFHLIRCACPCAVCVDEFTGVRLLDPATVSTNVHPVSVDFTGNYALKIVWSDRHDSGIFTWEHLRSLCDTFESSNS